MPISLVCTAAGAPLPDRHALSHNELIGRHAIERRIATATGRPILVVAGLRRTTPEIAKHIARPSVVIAAAPGCAHTSTLLGHPTTCWRIANDLIVLDSLGLVLNAAGIRGRLMVLNCPLPSPQTGEVIFPCNRVMARFLGLASAHQWIGFQQALRGRSETSP